MKPGMTSLNYTYINKIQMDKVYIGRKDKYCKHEKCRNVKNSMGI